MCYESGIPVTSLPGAAACITALTISGLSTRRFAFEAFLPSDKKEREQILKEMETETRTMIVSEIVSGAAWKPEDYRMPGVDKTS